MRSLFQKARGLFSSPPARRSALERRKIKRVACHQSFICSSGKSSWPVTVVDLGFGGFKIRSREPVGKRGDLLHLRRLSPEHLKKLDGSYTIGLMVRVAWSKHDEDGWETGLYLPEAPGSMRIRWFKELLKELDLDETEIFSKRSTRRHRCRLPSVLFVGSEPATAFQGMLFDLSSGGALFASSRAAMMGSIANMQVEWGVKTLSAEVSVVGVRPSDLRESELRFLHSLRFTSAPDPVQQKVLDEWLEELSLNG